MIEHCMSEPKKKIRVVATFPVNLGEWKDSIHNILKKDRYKHLYPMHFMEAIFNPKDFVEPNQQLYGKILAEVHEAIGNHTSSLMAGFTHGDAEKREATQIVTSSLTWQLLESNWFKIKYHDKPVLFWLYAGSNGGKCMIAFCTFMLGVEVEDAPQ